MHIHKQALPYAGSKMANSSVGNVQTLEKM